MIGLATIISRYAPDGIFIFPLAALITEMRTQSFLGMDFCQKQLSGIQFGLPRIEIKITPKSICHGSFHQNKSYPHLSQVLTIGTPYTMCINVKVPIVGSNLPQTLTHTSHEAQLFNRIEVLWLMAYRL